MVTKPQSHFIMERRGIFSPIYPTTNQCKQEHHQFYDYTCKLVFQNNSPLDYNDFLIDHIEINNIITNCDLKGSCERMEITIMNTLRAELIKRGIEVLAIKLTIIPKYPEGQATLTYIYSEESKYLLLLI